MYYDLIAAEKLLAGGINAPKTSHTAVKRVLFEKRSFIFIQQVDGASLERSLPPCFNTLTTMNTNQHER